MAAEDTPRGQKQKKYDVIPDPQLLDSVAETGIGSKLHGAFIPELVRMIVAMEAVVPAWAEHQSSRGLATARAFLLIRGTRGDRGVPFVQNYILEHKDSFMSAAEVFAADFAMQLLDAAIEHGNEHYPGEYNWAGHCEGNHKFLSGMQFLAGLAQPEGATAFCSVADTLQEDCELILSPYGELPPNFCLQVMSTRSRASSFCLCGPPKKRCNGVYPSKRLQQYGLR